MVFKKGDKMRLGKRHKDETKEKIKKKLMGRRTHRRGLTLEKEYGVGRATEIKKKLRMSHMGQKVSLETRQKMSKFRKGKIPSNMEKLIKSAKKFKKGNVPKNKGKTWEESYGKEKSDQMKRNKSEREKVMQKNRWESQIYRDNQLKSIFRGMIMKPNKPEKMMMGIIKENNFPFNYVGDGKIIIGGFNPDFLSKNPKHIIEVFGDYWHNRRENIERDKRRLETYEKYGYKTLIVWEHELKNKILVLKKIREFL